MLQKSAGGGIGAAARAVFLFVVLAACTFAQTISIQFHDGVFRVAGYTATAPPEGGWPAIFQVFAGEGDTPLFGSYAVESGVLIFRPRFPLSPGMKVRAVFTPSNAAPVTGRFEIPRPEMRPVTRVAHVYPSASLLPQNELKFYLYFSAPMARGEAWKHIRLLNASGAAVDLPFLEIDQELWDPGHQRLTVLFDPGRIKRGVLPLEQLGPAIEEGQSYTLVIDSAWPDGNGVPLVESFRKSFRVGPADRTPPDPANWRITAARAGTADALLLDFPEPMDYALLQHSIGVVGPEGSVAGAVAVDRDETQWRFTPKQPWKTGSYRLVIETTLEDLAGNHVLRAFDVDTFEKVTKEIPKDTVSLPFRVGRD